MTGQKCLQVNPKLRLSRRVPWLHRSDTLSEFVGTELAHGEASPRPASVFDGLFDPEPDRFWLNQNRGSNPLLDASSLHEPVSAKDRVRGHASLENALVDELSAEFVTDPPCQPALARAAFRQDDGELAGNVEMFRDHLHAAG